MGRSVNYLNNADVVIFFKADWINEEEDNSLAQMNWDDFYDNLKYEIKGKLKSYNDCDKFEDREISIFLDNQLCEIGLSEYCGLYSLSIRAKESYYYNDVNTEALGKHHAGQIEKTLCKILKDNGCDVFNKVGTFSDGNSVYELAK